MSKGTLKMDQKKVVEILNLPPPTTSTEILSFHSLTQLYRKFVRKFSGICAPFLETVNGGIKSNFRWTLEAKR